MSGIRIANVPDVKAIVEIAYELIAESAYDGIKVDESKFRLACAGLMGSKNGLVLVIVDDDDKPQGFLMGIIDELFFSRSRYATDLAVYVRKGYRHLAPRMFKEFIAWAKSKPRIVEITLGVSSGIGNTERIGKMYESLGFASVGGLYMQRI